MEIITSENIVSSGTSLSGCLVARGGILRIQSEGWCEEIGLADGGAAFISSGGILYLCGVSSGGTATVLSSGYVQDVTVESSGLFLVSSGGTAHHSIIMSGGTQIVYADTMAASANVLNGGVLQVGPDGQVPGALVSHGGTLFVQQEGVAEKTRLYGTAEIAGAVLYTEVLDGGRLDIQSAGWSLITSVGQGGLLVFQDGAIGQLDTIYDGGTAVVSSGGSANITTVNPGGSMLVSSGGTATEITENGGWVEVAEKADAVFASNTFSGLVLSGASATVHSGTTAADVSAGAGGVLEVFSGGKLTGTQTFETGAVVSMYESAILDFNISEQKSGTAALVNDLTSVQGAPLFTLTVSGSQPNGRYALAGGATGFNSPITVQDALGELIGVISVGDTFKLGDADCTLNLNSSTLSLAIRIKGLEPENLVGTKDRMSWDPPALTNRCVVECSTDGFRHSLSVATSAHAVDLAELPAGTYQWRVKADGDTVWTDGEAFASEAGPDTPKVVTSNEDGCGDIFFASTDGVWDSKYASQHVGSLNDWNGTGECVAQTGRGRIRNLFFGSTDPNMLCLTDGENGDAIFVDDIYTDLPEEVEANTARLYRIQEIRAGAGDDIVDMTSQRFEYTGDGLTIRGGDGDDIIWANKGSNALFGDAGNDRLVGASGNDVIAGGIGNDRLHGGGGDDVFTFCDNWGADKVEQLAGGMVTLWFASGDESNWNAGTLTYTDGSDSVTVSGVTADKITLKFGDDGSAQFAEMTAMGAFDAFSSRLIFGESGTGILASL